MGIDPGSTGGICIIKNIKDQLPSIKFFLKMPIVNLYGKKIIDSQKILSKLK